MLNMTRVLKYVKLNLGGSLLKIELTDEDIRDYIKEFTIRTFSKYVPDEARVSINPTNPYTRDSLVTNKFYIEDLDGLEILNVQDIVTSLSADVVLGHPYLGVMSYSELPAFTLAAVTSRDAKLFSPWDITFKYYSPNTVEIFPAPDSLFIVEYERVQPPDLHKIPVDLSEEFLKLALADIKIVVGQIRSKYGGNLPTPFGTIPLVGDVLGEGRDERREVLEKLEARAQPNVTLEIG